MSIPDIYSKKAKRASRKYFKRSIEDVLAIAAYQFFRCVIYDKFGMLHRENKWSYSWRERRSWEYEYQYQLDKKLDAKFARFRIFEDTPKAISEVIFEVARLIDHSMRRASNTMADYLRQSPSQMYGLLTQSDVDDFIAEARKGIERALEFDKPIEEDTD